MYREEPIIEKMLVEITPKSPSIELAQKLGFSTPKDANGEYYEVEEVEMLFMYDTNTLDRLRAQLPNSRSTEKFTEIDMQVIESFRRERKGITRQETATSPYIADIEYQFPLMCEGRSGGCTKAITNGSLFYALIDPIGYYKLSINEAFKVVGYRKACCKMCIRNPSVLNFESAVYNIRYATGNTDLSKKIADSSQTIVNMYVKELVPEEQRSTNFRAILPVIENSLENINEMQIVSRCRDNIDPESGIKLPPGVIITGRVDVGNGKTVPIVSKHFNLRKTNVK